MGRKGGEGKGREGEKKREEGGGSREKKFTIERDMKASAV